jgi:adenosylcobinamide-GDP ribazoletransferase
VTASLRVAFAFLTRLPVASPALTVETMSRATPWFPLVGLAVGATMGGIRALAEIALDAPPATVLALLGAVLLTGGLHEDGLADCADAVGAHASRERRREILHDPRVGTFGALALIFAVTLAVAALAPLDTSHFLRTALAAQLIGRLSTVVIARFARRDSRVGSAQMLQPGRAASAVSATCALAALVAIAGPSAAGVALAASASVSAIAVVTIMRAIGSLNGDALGAVTTLATLATYGALGARWS